ncbi:MAG TPA: DinB family protein [Tepidiformaceae bacterium]|nr:DinB family protein [Tepidiformaceae bacterium]HMO97378.1 DinB family protein [Tepidiformaceae bacterium]
MPRLPDDVVPVFDRFIRGPGVVRAAMDGIGPTEMSRPGREGWSIRDVLVHLSDAEMVRAIRFRLILASDEPPTIFGFDETTWKKRLQYLWRSPEAALALYESLIYTSAELLRQYSPKDWDRTGIHETEGPLSVRTLLERGADHAEAHARQIGELRSQLGPA